MKILIFLFRKILYTVLFVVFVYGWWRYFRDGWTYSEALDFFYRAGRIILPIVGTIYISYKTFIERWLLLYYRSKSGEVLTERLSKIVQKSGAVRSGKDASTVGAALLVKKNIIEKELKELRRLRYVLWIYDFGRLDAWLNKNGEQFLVAGDQRHRAIFIRMMREHHCFIKQELIDSGKVDPRKHYFLWSKHAGQRVMDFNYRDGLTPGGVPFLDLLKSYVIMYVQHIFVPNFIMSNQPIMEDFGIEGKTIKKLFSKKFSQEYIKLKDDKPIPLPLRGFIIETETAIFYSNTDKAVENENKNTNGIREFYTTAGHTLREQVFLYGITQSATRVSKAMRELYPGYQHVFKHRYRGTSGYTRVMLSIVIALTKFKIARLKAWRAVTTKLQVKVLKRDRERIIRKGIYTRWMNHLTKRISKLEAFSRRLFNRGFIEFYIGVYENLEDVGKRVDFPKMGVLIESKADAHTYYAFGFKQTNLIKDTWGRYDTHYMKFIRDEKEKDHPMHFADVPSWESFNLAYDDADYMGYRVFKEIFQFVVDKIDRKHKDRVKRSNLLHQDRTKAEAPDFAQMFDDELFNLASDYGITVVTPWTPDSAKDPEHWKEVLVTRLIKAYREFHKKDIKAEKLKI